jgi:hypothetical protein
MKKNIRILLLSLLIVAVCAVIVFILIKIFTKEKPEEEINEPPEPVIVKKLKIINEDSNSRPYAIVINNYPASMKVQAGLNDAYIIYEFPIEGGYSRSMALYKDKTTDLIGTIRSARQNYVDYVLENDAIFVSWGTNKPADISINELHVVHIDGNVATKPFFRQNPEKLSREHTGYTSLVKLKDYATNDRGIPQTTNVKPPIKYSVDEIDISGYEGAIVANDVYLPYSNSYKLHYYYNAETGLYERTYNGKEHKDYYNGERFTTKNILLVRNSTGKTKGYKDSAGNEYLDLKNVGDGDGYFITNGYAKKILWHKETRSSQTIYKYEDGTEVKVNDGKTYINHFPASRDFSIN